MSLESWAKFGQIVASIGVVAALVSAAVTFLVYLQTPSSLLVADIRPMAFRLPVTGSQLSALIRPGSSDPGAAGNLLQASASTSLVKIDLHNNGESPIKDIHVLVPSATIFAHGTEGLDDTSSFFAVGPEEGVTIKELGQQRSQTLYVWTRMLPDFYRHWDTVDGGFIITHSQGVARKNIYIEGSLLSGWLERNIGRMVALIAVCGGVGYFVALVFRRRSKGHGQSTPTGLAT